MMVSFLNYSLVFFIHSAFLIPNLDSFVYTYYYKILIVFMRDSSLSGIGNISPLLPLLYISSILLFADYIYSLTNCTEFELTPFIVAQGLGFILGLFEASLNLKGMRKGRGVKVRHVRAIHHHVF